MSVDSAFTRADLGPTYALAAVHARAPPRVHLQRTQLQSHKGKIAPRAIMCGLAACSGDGSSLLLLQQSSKPMCARARARALLSGVLSRDAVQAVVQSPFSLLC